MRTLTEKYNAVLQGEYSKKQFVRDARLAHPNIITQYNGYEDTVAILKNKGMVFEALDKYKEEKISDHQYEADTESMFSIEEVERGIDYELEKKGFNTIHRDFNEDDYLKAKDKAIKNLEKNRNYYLSLLGGESTRIQKNRKDVMKPVEKDNHVDKGNGMIKADLNESINEIKEAANTNLELKSMAKQLYLGFKKMGADVELATNKAVINKAKDDTGKLGFDRKNVWIYLGSDSKGDYLQIILVGDKAISFEDTIKNDPAFSRFKYIEDPGPLAGHGDGTTWGGQKVRYMYFRPGATTNEGRRPKSKGGKVVKEDDYGNGGYVELMSADLDKGIKLIQKAWDDWKAGPMTEPGMIEHAKEDLIAYISNELTFIEDQDTVSEEEIEALQEKKSQLKETFKKLIVKVLTEDKKKVNEDIKGVVDLSKYEPQVADEIKKVDPTVQKVDVELSHQEDAELAQAEIVVTPGNMDAEELRDKTIGNPKRFFTGGLRSYFINTLKNVSIDIRDGNLYISFDFYVNPFAGEQGKQHDPAFTAKMKRGDYGRLDEKNPVQEGTKVHPGPLKVGGDMKTTKGVYMNPDTRHWFVVINGKGDYIGPFKSSGEAEDAQVKYASLDYTQQVNEKETEQKAFTLDGKVL